MLIKYSNLFGVTSKDFENEGAFDGIFGIDSSLFIDPALLRLNSIPELSTSSSLVDNYFREVLILIAASKFENDIFYNKAVKKLTFPEIKEIALGLSENGIAGRGVGPILARRLTATASKIFQAGIAEPSIFELVGN